MRWFWGKDERRHLEERLAELEAKTLCCADIAFLLLRAAPDEQREWIINMLKEIIGKHIGERGPETVPQEYHQVYRNELSRTLQIFVHLNEMPKPPHSN
jgi:hypothetical protein